MKGISQARSVWCGALRCCAVVSGIFALLVIVLMVINVAQTKAADPLDTPQLNVLRESIAASPDDATLREELRSLDRLARHAFFASRNFTQRGAILLLVATVVFVLSSKAVMSLEAQPALPTRRPTHAVPAEQAARLRMATSVAGLLILVAAAVLIAWTRNGPSLADIADPDAKAVGAPAARIQDWDALKQNWPSFRGPGGIGLAETRQTSTRWNGPTGEGIRWKTAIPSPGRSSPIVWGTSVFLSGATPELLEVHCFDAETGALRWSTPVTGIPGSPAKWPGVSQDTGYAASTPATDGTHVFALFGTGDLIALDFDGHRRWARNIGWPDNPYGHASSLIVQGGLLHVQYDQKESARLYTYDARSGELVWDHQRPVSASWSSPVRVTAGTQELLVLCASPFAMAYDPVSGKEQWRVDCLSGEVAPSPAYGADTIYVVNQTPALSAIDARSGALKWQYAEYPSDVPSPVATDAGVIMVGSDGYITCLAATNGNVLWEHALESAIYGSPVRVGELVYLLHDNGRMSIIGAGRSFERVSECELGEDVAGTPAFVGGRIYLRGESHLFCIEQGMVPE